MLHHDNADDEISRCAQETFVPALFASAWRLRAQRLQRTSKLWQLSGAGCSQDLHEFGSLARHRNLPICIRVKPVVVMKRYQDLSGKSNATPSLLRMLCRPQINRQGL